MDELVAMNTPEGLIDYAGALKPEPDPETHQLETFGPRDAEAVKSLFYTRKCVCPMDGTEFEGSEMKDFFRFGWYPTNLGIQIGKRKPVGSSGFELDAGLLCPFVSPRSLFCPGDYKDWHHSLNFFIITMRNAKDPNKLPAYLLEWHKDDLRALRLKFRAAQEYLGTRAPAGKKKEWNLFKGNRHPRSVQRAHHISALTWQLMQGYEKSKGFKSREIDAWCYVLAFEMLYTDTANGEAFDYNLARFVAMRMKDVITLDGFGDVGFQNYFVRYVFLQFWLGEAEEAWNAACQISKVRGSEFTKSPAYDAIIEMRDAPKKLADLFQSNPKEVLTYFRL
jgi:hypothetical protein